MRSGRIQAIVIAVVLCVLAGCNRASRNSAYLKPSQGSNRAAALSAVENLRKQFNEGACQTMYDQASERFRSTESSDDWHRDCRKIREKLGTWETFDPKHADTYEIGREAQVEGPVIFANGIGNAIIDWQWNGTQLQLIGLSVQTHGEIIALPESKDQPPDHSRLL